MPFSKLYQPHHGPPAENSYENAEEQVVIVVHFEHHAATANCTTEENSTAQPSCGIESENEREGHEQSNDSSRGGGMCGDFDPNVDHSTDNLNE